MIAAILSFSLRYRGLVVAAALLLAWAGVRALYQIPVDAIPDLSENQVIVFSDWMGHAPVEIEDRITQPLMNRLRGMAGVSTVRSSSDINFSMIHVVFHDEIEITAARRQVEEQLAGGRDDLPSDARTYLAPEAPATGQIFWYTVEGDGLDLGQLRAIQDFYVKAQLATVEGVAEVASVGGFVREYQIEVDPWKLAAHRSTLGAVLDAIGKAQATVGGSVVQRAGQEFVVRVPGWFGVDEEGSFSEQRAIHDLRQVIVPATDGTSPLLGDMATIGLGPGPRRGALEKDGNEVTGGVVMMRYGENPRQVTARLLKKIALLRGGLPPGVRIVPGYDRTALIDAAVGTVTRALVEAVITSVVCVLIILLHVRSSLVIAVTLPLATLATFALLHLLRSLGFAQIPTNIMSLSGIAISIGVLVDSSIVVTENIMHRLRLQWGDRPVTGDTRPLVMEACRTVVRPIFFSILIMLVSFLPVLTMGGSAGKMFRPLALTKIIALGWVALLAMTLVPVLASYLVRGRLRREEDSWIVRSLIEVYRPLLQFLLDRPAAMFWMMTVTVMLGVAPLGIPWLFRTVLLVGAVVCGCTTTRRGTQLAAVSSLLLLGLCASGLRPLEHETNFITPLDEGTVMDMPITIPRIGLSQALDDMKARDMIICRFPEVEMVMGKVGRAETPTDPAPVDMIETMVSLRPRDYWPRRKLQLQQAQEILASLWAAAEKSDAIAPLTPPEQAARLDAIQAEVLPRFDTQMREFAYHRQREFLEELRRLTLTDIISALVEEVPSHRFQKRPTAAELPAITAAVSLALIPHHGSAPSEMEIEEVVNQAAWEMQERGWIASLDELLNPELDWWERTRQFGADFLGRPSLSLMERVQRRTAIRLHAHWLAHAAELDRELIPRGAATIVRLGLEELLRVAPARDAQLVAELERLRTLRESPPTTPRSTTAHHATAKPPPLNPLPQVDQLQADLTPLVAGRLVLWRATREDLGSFGGEMDATLQMPGWTNVWTRPIQNRVDMLNTGIGSTAVAIRVLGKQLDDVVETGDVVAAVLKELPGAANVIADPVRGKVFLDVQVDRERAIAQGVDPTQARTTVQVATAGTVVGETYEGRARHPIRVRFPRSWREDEAMLHDLPIARHDDPEQLVKLADVAAIGTREGPAAIKGENGLLRIYVRCDVRGRDAAEFVRQAQSVVARRVRLPAGVFLEWTGGFEYWEQTRRTLLVIAPVAVLLTLLLLYWTYRDWADALLLILAVPGALAGGLFLQWLWGCKFSMTVAIGYLSCFGMATATAVIMLVYLREAVESAGGLEQLSLAGLRAAVVNGAVHRLRPKLLAEATTLIGLAPMIWATGVGAEVIGPMAVPVLGGILVADEVIDLFLPVMFYWVRSRRWRRLHALPE